VTQLNTNIPMQKIEARIPNSSFRIFATTFEIHSYVVTERVRIERIVFHSSKETEYLNTYLLEFSNGLSLKRISLSFTDIPLCLHIVRSKLYL
jgi:hypothetical protein